MKEYDLISYLSCLFSVWVAGCGCMCLSNDRGTRSGSTGKPTAANTPMIQLGKKKHGHDPNLSRKSKDKHCNLKSSAIWIGRPLLFQRPHFIQQLTLGNTSFLEIGKAFCSISRGRKKIFIIFDQPIKPEAYNNQKDKNIIKLRLLRLCKGHRR